MKMFNFALAAVLLLTGCAESLDHFHRGNRIVERHYMPGTWGIPGNTVYVECDEKQMVHSVFWAKKVCPSSIDPSAYLAVDRGNIASPNYASMVVPSAIQAAGMITMGGLVMNGLLNQNVARMTQSVTGGTVYGSTITGAAIKGLQFYPN